ncbi:MAG: sulfate ABC transporter ATP-binding protein [Phycisphaerae bacterium]|nr:MAG: sulfate ABC transporter ATP-binding protein [Planctomycetota bacterium]KAB2937322.1 MAG: sulfate ABC transporter ATP-binding protein [Phycisphaerae bacterium]MBE7457150.1 sulfate ABC transporter ATP-binding protein [Planctomycetia bacterium]MCK6463491.1 sulfate ABC transporter ATP-binding protein [Phycisphaerae bacterium]MCL4718973.1 sulfate ABC transporter ATP-binding protein [Phycisphaerae bacterium]
MSIEIQGVTKVFGDFKALDQIDLTVPSGELVALLGPSGSGKTTLLRVIAGLESADDGSILFDGEDATTRHVRERGVGFVFQHYALFRHMSVFENVAFGLRVRPRRLRPSREEIRERVMKLLKLVQLEHLGKRYPGQLSGGQRQRVALARALAVEPKVLLLDEPFGALDARVRQELRSWLRRLHDEIHVTSVFVTHDQEEALEVADRVVVMSGGRIEQIGTPEEVFHHPANEFVMHFLGNVNVFHGRVEGGKAVFGDVAVEHGEAGTATRSSEVEPLDDEAKPAKVFIRPHEWDIAVYRNGRPAMEAVVIHVNAAGPVVKVSLLSESGEPVHAELPLEHYRSLELRTGQRVFLSPRKVKVFFD